jgi:hypothetical protein
VRFGGEHVPNSPFQVTVRRGQGWVAGGSGKFLACYLCPFVMSKSPALPLCSPGIGWRSVHSAAPITASAAGSTVHLCPGWPADLGKA